MRKTPRSDRGAGPVEYALGLGVAIAALLVGVDSVTHGTAQAYDDRRGLVTTGVTDGAPPSTSATTPSSTGEDSTPTLPPPLPPPTPPPSESPATTPPTTPSTTTPTAQTSAVGMPNNGNHWSVTITVTVAPPVSGLASGTTAMSNGSNGTWSCTLNNGTCTTTLGTFNGSHVEWVDVTTTSVSTSPPASVSMPPTVRANEP